MKIILKQIVFWPRLNIVTADGNFGLETVDTDEYQTHLRYVFILPLSSHKLHIRTQKESESSLKKIKPQDPNKI